MLKTLFFILIILILGFGFYFPELGVQKTAPCHCSGDRCRELFKEEYGENFIENGVGKIINIE